MEDGGQSPSMPRPSKDGSVERATRIGMLVQTLLIVLEKSVPAFAEAGFFAILIEGGQFVVGLLIVYGCYKYVEEVRAPRAKIVFALFLIAITTFLAVRTRIGHEPAPEKRVVEKTFTLQANRGWQNVEFEVKEPSYVLIEVSGRINLAINQQFHLADVLKPLLGNSFGKPILNIQNRFDRSWITARDNYGDHGRSDLFEDLKIEKLSPWGIVLCTTHGEPPPTVEEDDPWMVLDDVNLSEIRAISNSHKEAGYYFNKPGSLICVINDAVISPRSPDPTSRAYFDKLTDNKVMNLDRDHRFQRKDVPLLLFNDNAGEFTLTIKNVTANQGAESESK